MCAYDYLMKICYLNKKKFIKKHTRKQATKSTGDVLNIKHECQELIFFRFEKFQHTPIGWREEENQNKQQAHDNENVNIYLDFDRKHTVALFSLIFVECICLVFFFSHCSLILVLSQFFEIFFLVSFIASNFFRRTYRHLKSTFDLYFPFKIVNETVEGVNIVEKLCAHNMPYFLVLFKYAYQCWIFFPCSVRIFKFMLLIISNILCCSASTGHTLIS